MKATFIKQNNKRPTQEVLNKLVKTIESKALRLGFRTFARVESLSGIHIGHHRDTFSILPEALGHNVRYPYQPDGLPWKRTRKPTWDQRVQFNNLINDIFDELKLTARIVSGTFIVRTRENGRVSKFYQTSSSSLQVEKYTDKHAEQEKIYKAIQRKRNRPTKEQIIEYMKQQDKTLTEMLVSNDEWERKHVTRFKWR